MILLASDIHADEYRAFAKYDKGMNSRLHYILDALAQLREYALENDVKEILLGGDLFHKRGVISTPVYYYVHDALSLFEREGIRVYSIVGNHDQAVRSGETHSLKGLPIEVVERAGVLYLDNLKVGCVSFCETNREFLTRLQGIATEETPDAYLIHHGIRGAKFSGDEILSKDLVTIEDIRAIVGDDVWVFSGHYHIYQQMDPLSYYIGSLLPKDFGDVSQKGFLSWDGKEVRQIESRAPRFVTVNANELKDPVVKKAVQGNYVRVAYAGKEPKLNLDALGVVTYRTEVDREYEQRLEISTGDSPMQIIQKYLDAQTFEEVSVDDVKAVLPEVLGSISLETGFGGKTIDLVNLQMANFMSYADEEINFSDYEGIVEIEGRNLDDPSAQSNGSGKSVIPEALQWVLFGDTLRGLSGDKVISNMSGVGCSVTLLLLANEEIYQVKRFRKDKEFKNQLFFSLLDGDLNEVKDLRGKSDAETQTVLQKVLGIDEMSFANSVFFGYGLSKPFASMTDKEQKAVLENTVGCGYFPELQERARDLSKSVQDALTDTQAKLTYLEKRQEELSKDQAYAVADSRAWVEKNEVRVRELKAELSMVEDYLETIGIGDRQTQLDEINAAIVEYQGALADYEKTRAAQAECSKAIFSQMDEIRSVSSLMQVAESKRDKFISEMKLLEAKEKTLSESYKSQVCATCKQSLQDEWVASLKEQSQELKIQIQKQHVEAKRWSEVAQVKAETLERENVKLEGLRKEEDRLASLCADQVEFKKLYDELERERTKLEAQITAVVSTRASLERESSELKESIVGVQMQDDPHQEAIKRISQRLEEADAEMVTIREKSAALTKRYLAFKFWDAAFSDKGSSTQSPIKSYLFDSIVPVLDDLVRAYTEVLTLGSMSVKFNTVTALKTGELRDKFGIVVENKYGSDDYLGDSSGERKKVDLPIMFALHALARLKSGSRFNVLFMDEVLDSLDAQGCSRVMLLLREIAPVFEKIFVITHNQNLKEMFNDRILVEKKDKVSRIVRREERSVCVM